MPLAEQQVWTKLKECYDPELPCNIVDLGLVYEVKVSPLEDSDDTRVDVRMTLTSQGCPMSKQILAQVQQKLLDLKGVGEANVEIVYDPPWDLRASRPKAARSWGMRSISQSRPPSAGWSLSPLTSGRGKRHSCRVPSPLLCKVSRVRGCRCRFQRVVSVAFSSRAQLGR